MKWLFYVLFGVREPTNRWWPPHSENPDFEAYRRWWMDNAPAWNLDNQHDYGIGLVAWMDSRSYWKEKAQ